MQRDGFPVSGRFVPRRFTPNFEPEDDSFHVQCMKWIRSLEAKRPQFRYLVSHHQKEIEVTLNRKVAQHGQPIKLDQYTYRVDFFMHKYAATRCKVFHCVGLQLVFGLS